MAGLKITTKASFQFPADAATQAFGILGIRGSGKTSTGVVLFEEMIAQGNQCVWIDPVGVAWGLQSDYEVLIFGGDHANVPIESRSGKFLAGFLVENRVPSIVDVSDFNETEKRTFVGDFLTEFYQLQKKDKQSVHLFIDEADMFAPQRDLFGGMKCLGAMQNIVRRGRSRGIGITMISQRVAAINKDVFTQTECLFVHRLTAPHDIKMVAEWLKFHGSQEQANEIADTLSSLKTGECWVSSPSWLEKLVKVQIRPRTSFDSSSTPKPNEAVKHPKSLKQIDIPKLTGQMAAFADQVKSNDPVELRKQVAELKRQLALPAPVDNTEEVKKLRSLLGVMKSDYEELWNRHESMIRSLQAFAEKMNTLSGEACQYLMDMGSIGKAETGIPESVDSVNPDSPIYVIASKNTVMGNRVTPGPVPRMPPGYLVTPKRPLEKQVDDKSLGTLQKVLDAISWWGAAGVNRPTNGQVGFVAGYVPTGGTFQKYLSTLSSKGLICRDSGTVGMLPDGWRRAMPYSTPGTLSELHERIFAVVHSQSLVKILKIVAGNGRNMLSNEDLAAASGFEPKGGTFQKYLSTLSSLGLINRSKGMVEPTDILMPTELV